MTVFHFASFNVPLPTVLDDIMTNDMFIARIPRFLWGPKVELNAYFLILKIFSNNRNVHFNIKNPFSNIKKSFSNSRNSISNIRKYRSIF